MSAATVVKIEDTHNDGDTAQKIATGVGGADSTVNSLASFPPHCPILYYNEASSMVAMGNVMTVQKDGTYIIKVLKQIFRDIPSKQLSFAPGCPVKCLPWKKSQKWKRAAVLGSYQKEDGPIYYSVSESTSTKKLVHHGIPLDRIRFDDGSSLEEEEGPQNEIESTCAEKKDTREASPVSRTETGVDLSPKKPVKLNKEARCISITSTPEVEQDGRRAPAEQANQQYKATASSTEKTDRTSHQCKSPSVHPDNKNAKSPRRISVDHQQRAPVADGIRGETPARGTSSSPSRSAQEEARSIMASILNTDNKTSSSREVPPTPVTPSFPSSERQSRRPSPVQTTCEMSSEAAASKALKHTDMSSSTFISPDKDRALIGSYSSLGSTPYSSLGTHQTFPVKKRPYTDTSGETPTFKRHKVSVTKDSSQWPDPTPGIRKVKTITLPPWVDFGAIRENLIGKGGWFHKQLENKLRCGIHWADRNEHGPPRITIKATEQRALHLDSIIAEVEGFLLTNVSKKEASLLLYDLARINGYGERYKDLVKQRSPPNLNKQVWMCRVPFPRNFHKFHGCFLGKKGSGVYPIIKETHCVIDIPQQGEPCAIVYGEDFKHCQRCVDLVMERIQFAEDVYYAGDKSVRARSPRMRHVHS